MKITSYVPNKEIFNIKRDNKVINTKENTFSGVLKKSLDKINQKQRLSDEATKAFVRGEDIEISDVMLLGEEAKISLQYAVQVRNKLVEAYQEISRMQL